MTCYVADLGSQNPVDFTRLKAASYQNIKCEGVSLRATRSNCLTDKAFATRVEAAAKLAFLLGGYAFCTGETAAVQAARYLGMVKPFLDIVLMHSLDYEKNPSGQQMTISAAVEYLDRIAQAIGRRPWLYSGDWVKTNIVHATDTEREALSEVFLWGAEYGPRWRDLDNNGHLLPWDEPKLRQFTGDGIGPLPHTLDGLEQGADLSVFDGTREDLASVWPGAPVAVAA